MRDGVFLNLGRRDQNTMHSGVFLMDFEVLGNVVKHYLFPIENKTVRKTVYIIITLKIYAN